MSVSGGRENELPIACTLDAGQMDGRVAEWRRLAQESLIGSARSGTRVTLTYRHATGVEERLQELVSLESRCCSFLRFESHREGDKIVLDIDGPQEAAQILDMFASGSGG